MTIDAPLTPMAKVLRKEEYDYIENTLKACSEDLKIKTYEVVREKSFEDLKKVIDSMVEKNVMLELAAKPLNIAFLNVERWVAILVEYEEL